jgi:TonB family protein
MAISRIIAMTSPGPRMLFALALSIVLHLWLLRALEPPPQRSFGPMAIVASFTGPAKPPGLVSDAAGEAALPSPLPTAEQARVVPGAGPGPSQPAAAPPARPASSQPSGTGNTGYYALAAVQGAFEVSGAVSDAPIMNAPDFMPFTQLAPKPALPAGFNIPYPESAKAAAGRAMVKVAVFLDEFGRVVEVLVIEDNSPSGAFAEAVTLAVRQAQFRPGAYAGRPVKSKLTLRVQFGYE